LAGAEVALAAAEATDVIALVTDEAEAAVVDEARVVCAEVVDVAEVEAEVPLMGAAETEAKGRAGGC
jgi:hypothetical protein